MVHFSCGVGGFSTIVEQFNDNDILFVCIFGSSGAIKIIALKLHNY